MTTPSSPQEPFTPFLPTTYDIPEENDRLKSFFSDNFANFADVVNDKKIGLYMQAAETLNGEKWSYKTTSKTRNGYQAIAYIPSFPNSGTLTLTLSSDPQYPIPDINEQFIVTQVWGSASKPCSAVGAGDGDYFSFYSEGNSKVSFTMSDTTIVITTTTNLSAYSGFIVVQYVRDGV
jgi:hypothetical protein